MSQVLMFSEKSAPKCKESKPKEAIESFSLRSSRNSCSFGDISSAKIRTISKDLQEIGLDFQF